MTDESRWFGQEELGVGQSNGLERSQTADVTVAAVGMLAGLAVGLTVVWSLSGTTPDVAVGVVGGVAMATATLLAFRTGRAAGAR